MYLCYIVRCADGTLYTGVTTDLRRRLREHNAGRGARYTAGRRPVRLVWQEPHPDRASVQRREAQIKRLTRREKQSLVRKEAARPREIRKTTASYDVRRFIKLAGNGLVRIDQKVRVNGTQDGLDVTGPYWVFGLIKRTRGRIEYLHGEKRIKPPARTFGMFVPPFSLIHVELAHSRHHSMSLSSLQKLPGTVPQEPVIFLPPSERCPATVPELVRFLRRSRNFIPVSREENPTPLSVRVKKILDQTYATSHPLSGIARALRISPAVLSRTFKRDYGMPPGKYRHTIRVMDGMMRLLEGEAVRDVFQEVGFEDVSRFYRHFKKVACAPPGRYRTKEPLRAPERKSKTAKK